MYLHMVMVELFILPSTPVKIEQVPTVYTNLKEIDKRTGKTKLLMEYEVFIVTTRVCTPDKYRENTIHYHRSQLALNL